MPDAGAVRLLYASAGEDNSKSGDTNLENDYHSVIYARSTLTLRLITCAYDEHDYVIMSYTGDYPEHLNPFHQEKEKRKFWKLGRKNSFSTTFKDLRSTL